MIILKHLKESLFNPLVTASLSSCPSAERVFTRLILQFDWLCVTLSLASVFHLHLSFSFLPSLPLP